MRAKRKLCFTELTFISNLINWKISKQDVKVHMRNFLIRCVSL